MVGVVGGGQPLVMMIALWTLVMAATMKMAQAQDSHSSLVSYVLEPFDSLNMFGHPISPLAVVEELGNVVNVFETDADALHGTHSLQMEFKNTANAPEHKYRVLSNLQDRSVHICVGAKELSFAYKYNLLAEAASDPSITNDLSWKITLFDSNDCTDDCENPANLEAWEYNGRVLEVTPGDTWRTETISSFYEGWVVASGHQGNGVLDLDSLKGWQFEFTSLTTGLGGTLWLDQIALNGDGDMLGAAFHAKSYQKALDGGIIVPLYFLSSISETNTTEAVFNGRFYVDYTVEHTQDWGGFIQYDSALPARAYFNLSHAEAIQFDYNVVRAASTPQRAHLRFLVLDTSNCLDDCGHASPNIENYYSFHHILDAPGAGHVPLELRGDPDPNSELWQSFFFGAAGNNQLDKEHIKGFKIEVSLDSQGGWGFTVNGAFELSNLVALDTFDPNGIDTTQCLVEEGIRLVTRESTTFLRIEFLKYAECCDSCTMDDECNVAFSDGRDCYKAARLEADSVVLETDVDSKHVTFLKKSQDDFCNVCECRQSDLTIDCRGRGLAAIPSKFSPEQLDSPIPRPPSWTPKVLDLRNNPHLVILGRHSLSIVDSIEELRLPSGVYHLNEATLDDLPQLEKLSFGDTAGEETRISNAIMDPSSAYSDVCCSKGAEIFLSQGSTVESLTFCDLKPDVPGIDVEFEDYVQYSKANVIKAITPSSSFMFEAAENKYKCSEYCNIQNDCSYFSYDARLPNTEHVCLLLSDQGTPTRVCCDDVHYQDTEQTLPGWVSGRVARTRHSVDNARVVLSGATNLVADKSSGYSAAFDLRLGSMPKRGAVWIEPRVSAANIEVVLSPSRVVLYDNSTTATVNVTVASTADLQKGGSIVVEHSVESCDLAFSVVQSDLTVLVDVVVPGEESSDNSLWIAIGICLGVITFLIIFFLRYIEHKKKQADTVWHVDIADLNFDNPPKVIGTGSFGLVLLAEYRGTQVAVKRVIPPQLSKRGNKGSVSLKRRTIFDNGFDDSEGATREEPTQSSLADIELGVGFSSKGKGSGGGLASAAKTFQSIYWNKAFKYNKTRADSAKVKSDFVEEMRHLSKLRHPNITTVMGAVINRTEEPMLIMEFMDHGSLHELLQNSTFELEGEQLLPILRDIAQGVRFLHAANPTVIHGDLKARNILVDGRLRAKVADFGLAEKKRVGATGTPYWMAPELLLGETTNTTKSDVYSFGIMLFEVYSRQNPYEDEEFAAVMENVCNPIVKKRPPVPASCPPEIEEIMVQCWDAEPNKRPTFTSLDMRFKAFNVTAVEPTKPHVSLSSRRLSASNQKNIDIINNGTTDSLLDKVFPPHIATALRQGQKVEPESRECVTIVFSDIVGFTNISASMSAMKVADMLDRLYTTFDELSEKHDVFKVETIGDSWMGVTNMVKTQRDHVARVIAFANDAMRSANGILIDPSDPGSGCVNLRIGLHSGPVVANVVGSRSPRYCLFGDTVNTASRMESHSIPGRIQCSNASAVLLQKQDPRAKLTSRGTIFVKGKGHMETFFCDAGDTDLNVIPEAEEPRSPMSAIRSATSAKRLAMDSIPETIFVGGPSPPKQAPIEVDESLGTRTTDKQFFDEEELLLDETNL